MSRKKISASKTVLVQLRVALEERPAFMAAAAQDGYDELTPWLRWLARQRTKKVLHPTGAPNIYDGQ